MSDITKCPKCGCCLCEACVEGAAAQPLCDDHSCDCVRELAASEPLREEDQ